MTDVAYRNHRHYISEGWSAEPKEMFKRLVEILGEEWLSASRDVLDIGCATGELLGFLRRMVPGGRFVGVDVSEDLLGAGRRLLPEAEFVKASALDLPMESSTFLPSKVTKEPMPTRVVMRRGWKAPPAPCAPCCG